MFYEKNKKKLIITSQFPFFLHCKFEMRAFKLHIMCWAYIKNEPKVDMYQMSALIDQNIAIMSILNLQNIAHHRIGSLTLNEIIPSNLKFR